MHPKGFMSGKQTCCVKTPEWLLQAHVAGVASNPMNASDGGTVTVGLIGTAVV